MNKPLLEKLTPAEVLKLLGQPDPELKDLLRHTMTDLVLKKVLEVKTEKYTRQYPREIITYIHYIKPGKKFYSYRAMEYEEIFLAPFRPDTRLRILFRHMVKIILKSGISKKKFLKLVRKSPNLAGCFQVNFFQRITGKDSLSPNGNELRKKLNREIEELKVKLNDSLKQDKEYLNILCSTIFGNIFLLDSDLLPFASEMNTAFRQVAAFAGHGNGAGCSWTYSGFSGEFDSSCSSGCGSGCGGSCGSGCGGGGCGGGGCS